MNKKRMIGIVAAAVVVLLIIVPIVSYNSLVSMNTKVEEQSANIDAQLQRRMDLIPNLVNTVKGFTDHETAVFDSVTQARETLMSANTMSEKSQANEEMNSALNRLIAVAEAYPELKSDSVYVGLMDELAGTENRILNARSNYNESVTSYNAEIRKFPMVVLANLFGFDKAEFFEAADGAAQVVEVNLGK